MIKVRLTDAEFSAIINAARAVFESLEREESEPLDSFMAYTDNSNFIYQVSEKEYQLLKSALEKH